MMTLGLAGLGLAASRPRSKVRWVRVARKSREATHRRGRATQPCLESPTHQAGLFASSGVARREPSGSDRPGRDRHTRELVIAFTAIVLVWSATCGLTFASALLFGRGASLLEGYGETVTPIRGGLPKLEDFPAEVGGAGATITKRSTTSLPETKYVREQGLERQQSLAPDRSLSDAF